MARPLALLAALRKAIFRDLGSLLALGGNNLLLLIALISLAGPAAIAPFAIALGLPLLVVLCSDLMNVIPAERLRLWPLSRSESFFLRLGALGLNPTVWIALALLNSRAGWENAVLFIAMVCSINLLIVLCTQWTLRHPHTNFWRLIPRLPGSFGALLQLALRQILCALDTYAAMLFSSIVLIYRAASNHPDPDALAICAAIVALSVSTYTQRPFGLDTQESLARYRLLPVPAWQILMAKDGAFLIVVGILTLPIQPRVGITFGLAALAVGRYPALRHHVPQRKWRFTIGELRWCTAQIVLCTALSIGAYRNGWLFVLVAVSGYLLSLVTGIWFWKRRMAA